MRTIEAHRGWSGNKVRKVNKSVATSIVGSNTLKRKNFSNANILKVKTTEVHFHKSQSWFACGDFAVKSQGKTNQTDGASVRGRLVLLTEFCCNVYLEDMRSFPACSSRHGDATDTDALHSPTFRPSFFISPPL